MVPPVNGPGDTRPYRSPRREEQAAATRRRILRAAKQLFTTKGYSDTGVAEVARRAKVSVDTLYASVGRKPQLLLAVHDMVLGSADEPIPAEQREYVAAIARGHRRAGQAGDVRRGNGTSPPPHRPPGRVAAGRGTDRP